MFEVSAIVIPYPEPRDSKSEVNELVVGLLGTFSVDNFVFDRKVKLSYS